VEIIGVSGRKLRNVINVD
jgi:hypothetical protein